MKKLLFGISFLVLSILPVGANVNVPWESNFSLLPQDSDGWSILPAPSSDSRLIYVSDSDGNDATAQVYSPSDPEIGSDPMNPVGTVQAYATKDAAMTQVRSGFPDWILFKRGDMWNLTDRIRAKSGRSLSERAVIAYYGSAVARPYFETGLGWAIEFRDDVRFVVLMGLSFYANERDPNNLADFVGFENSSAPKGLYIWLDDSPNPTTSLLIEDCSFNFFEGNNLQGENGSPPISDIVIRRNQFLNTYQHDGRSQGMYADHASVFLEENLFDHNGWFQQSLGSGRVEDEGQATIYNHNTYFPASRETIFRKNMFIRPSSIGNKWTANTPDPPGIDDIWAWDLLMDNNLYFDGNIGISAGGNSDDHDNGYRWQNIKIMNNVFLDIGRSQPTNETLAWGIESYDWEGGEISGNVLAHYGNSTVDNVYGVRYFDHGLNVNINDNIFYDLYGDREIRMGDPADMTNVQVFNNQVELPASNYQDPNRTLETYMASLGQTPTFDAFLAEAKQQSKFNWRPEYTAEAVNDYIREGFQTSAIAEPRYWVGGSGNWSDASNWSDSSGGPGGAGAPGSGDDAIFDNNSGASIIILDQNVNVRDVHVQPSASANLTIDFNGRILTVSQDALFETGRIDQGGSGSTLSVGRNLDTANCDTSLREGNLSIHMVGTGYWRYTLGRNDAPAHLENPIIYNFMAAQGNNTTTLRPDGDTPNGYDIDVENQLQLGSGLLTMDLVEATGAGYVTIEIHSEDDTLDIVSNGARYALTKIEHEFTNGGSSGQLQNNINFTGLDTYDVTGSHTATVGAGPTWTMIGDMNLQGATLSIEKAVVFDTGGHSLQAGAIGIGGGSLGTGELHIRDSAVTISGELRVGGSDDPDRPGQLHLDTGYVSAQSLRSSSAGGFITGEDGSALELNGAASIGGSDTVYYVAENGDDIINNGLNPSTPFRSFNQALSVMGNNVVVLFQKGDQFTIPDGTTINSSGGQMGAYGSGPRPVLTMGQSDILNVDESGWNLYDLRFEFGNHSGNTSPTANAGQNETVALTGGQTSIAYALDGTGSVDPDGSIAAYRWDGNPNPSDIAQPVVNLSQGVYVFDLEVEDNEGATDTAQVTITVEPEISVPPPPNQDPVADAGSNRTIQLVGGQTTVAVVLDGTGSDDPDGSIIAYRWSGNPNPSNIAQPVVNLSQGVYVFNLEVEDNDGATDTAQVTITIEAASSEPPPPPPPPNPDPTPNPDPDPQPDPIGSVDEIPEKIVNSLNEGNNYTTQIPCDSQIDIYTLTGSFVESVSCTDGLAILNAAEYPSGIYLIRRNGRELTRLAVLQ